MNRPGDGNRLGNGSADFKQLLGLLAEQYDRDVAHAWTASADLIRTGPANDSLRALSHQPSYPFSDTMTQRDDKLKPEEMHIPGEIVEEQEEEPTLSKAWPKLPSGDPDTLPPTWSHEGTEAFSDDGENGGMSAVARGERKRDSLRNQMALARVKSRLSTMSTASKKTISKRARTGVKP